jgi:hypothetical protein
MQWKDSGGSEFQQPPVGTHLGICIKVIDLGTQDGEYQGRPTSKRQVLITFELPNELMTGENEGKPFIASKFYTASLSEKANLRHDLENWRGRAFTAQELNGFDSKNILGKPCLLSLTETEKKKVRITGIMAVPKGTNIPPAVNQLTHFSLDEFDANTFESISDGIKKIIMLSPEYKRATAPVDRNVNAGPRGSFDDMDSDIPFDNPYRGKLGYFYC